MNRNKTPEHRNKILMIWASRHFQNANPQNLLRPSDIMRILVPWRAFGDLTEAQQLLGDHERKLIEEEEAEQRLRLQDIEDAYGPLLVPLPGLCEELSKLESTAWKDNGYATKSEYTARIRELKRSTKDLKKIQIERNETEAEVKDYSGREIARIREAAADLLRICSDSHEASRYFTIIEKNEITTNEFNLNLSRYIETREPDEFIPLEKALEEFRSESVEMEHLQKDLFAEFQAIEATGERIKK